MDATTDRQDRLRHRLGPRPRTRHGRQARLAGRRCGDPRPGRRPVRRSTARPRACRRWRTRSPGTAPGSTTVLGNIGDPGRGGARCRAGSPPNSARWTSWSTAPAATSGPRAASRTRTTPSTSALEDIQVETNNNLIGTLLVSQAFVRPMRDRGIGLRHQHRVGRRAHGRDARGGLLDAQGGGRALHPMPRAGDAAARRAGQRGQPRADEDRPLPGDPHHRSRR